MWFHVDTRAGVPIYLQIVGQVRQAVAMGILSPGDQLPTVRELAVQLTVNPNTVAKAYQELEREGVIETARGRGTFVAQKQPKRQDPERLEHLRRALDRIFIEAHYIGINSAGLRALFEERLARWHPPENDPDPDRQGGA